MRKLFNVFATFGIILTLTELILNFENANLCNSYGCKLAKESLTIPDSWVITSGVLAFAVLLLLSITKKDEILDGLLSIILSVEGVFVSYQLFRMRHICYFCISVFFTFLILSLIRLLIKRWTVAIGIFSFVIIVLTFSILKPYTNTKCKLSRYTLIYSPNCSHCEKVIHYLEDRKNGRFSIAMIKAYDCEPFLKLLGIDAVPVLILKKRGKLSWIVGDKGIIEYFNNLTKTRTAQQNFTLENNELFINTNIQSGFCSFGDTSNSKCH